MRTIKEQYLIEKSIQETITIKKVFILDKKEIETDSVQMGNKIKKLSVIYTYLHIQSVEEINSKHYDFWFVNDIDDVKSLLQEIYK